MKAHFDFPLAGVSFTAAISKKILSEPLPDENAASRLKQIAFITIVYQLQAANVEATYAELKRVTGLPRASMTHFAAPLLRRGLLEERRVLNSAGRGHSHALFVPGVVLDGLAPDGFARRPSIQWLQLSRLGLLSFLIDLQV